MCLGLCLCEKITDNQGQGSAMNTTDMLVNLQRSLKDRLGKDGMGGNAQKDMIVKCTFFFF